MMSALNLSSGPQLEAGVSEPRGVRHAALLLHAMSPADRDWMLGELPSSERTNLLPLLAELEALGIESDPSLIDDAISSATPADSSTATSFAAERRAGPISDEAALHALDAQQVRALVECLRLEPLRLVGELLRLADWPWREDLLAALEPAQRRKIEAGLSETPLGYQVPPGMRSMLISGVSARLHERSVSGSGGSSSWSRFSQPLRQVLGGISLRGRFGR